MSAPTDAKQKRNNAIRAAKEGNLITPAGSPPATENIAPMEVRQKRIAALAKAREAKNAKRATVKDTSAEPAPVAVAGMDLKAKRLAALAKARAAKVAKKEAGKSAAVKEAEAQMKKMGVPKPRNARKPKAKAVVISAEEKKEAREALAARMRAAKEAKSNPEEKKEEEPKGEKVTIVQLRKSVREMRKVHCPPIAKMRRPQLLQESRRHLKSAGESAEAIDAMDLGDKSIRELRMGLKSLREVHCPPVGKMRKPALDEELKKLKGMSGSTEGMAEQSEMIKKKMKGGQ